MKIEGYISYNNHIILLDVYSSVDESHFERVILTIVKRLSGVYGNYLDFLESIISSDQSIHDAFCSNDSISIKFCPILNLYKLETLIHQY
jgi:hypothetical protein